MTRKRQGQNIYDAFGHKCSTCEGLGYYLLMPNFKKEDKERLVQVISLELEPLKKQILDLRYIQVETALPYDQIFDIEKREIDSEDRKDVKQFTKSLHSIKNLHEDKVTDGFEHLKLIATNASIAEEILNNANRVLQQVLESKDEVND